MRPGENGVIRNQRWFFIKLKALIMKKFILILIAFIGINLYLSAQSAGDYRSIGSGDWSDATKWEMYDGASWILPNSYPGQQPGTGAVTISRSNEIRITESPAYPISTLLVDIRVVGSQDPQSIGCSSADQFGVLIFSSENAVSLDVSEYIAIDGHLKIENRNGTKTHVLTAGGGLSAGTALYDCDFGSYAVGAFETVNQDDYLKVAFNTTWPGSAIYAPAGISFYDIAFNGSGIILNTPIQVYGTATFTNGIVTGDGYPGKSVSDGLNWLPVMDGGYITFQDGSTIYGASNASFVDGVVVKKGNDAFSFPIGENGVYAPLTISAPVEHRELSARYSRSDPGSFGGITDPALTNVSRCEYWLLSSLFAASISLDVTVNWNSASGCGSSPYIANVPEVKLGRFNYGDMSWNSHGGTGAGTASNGSVTWTGVTSLGYFTLGNVNTGCDPPSGLTTTNITTNSAIISWPAVAGAASYDVIYRAATSGTWINAATATPSTSVQLTGLTSLVNYFVQVRSNCGGAASSNRQTQFATISDCGTPSGLLATNITTTSAMLTWNVVAGAINYDIEYKKSYSSSWTVAASGISSTSYNLSGLSPVTTYDWRVRAKCPSSSAYMQAQFNTPNPCATPTGLVITNITSSSATLTWNPVPNASQYSIQYKQANSSAWIFMGSVTNLYQFTGLSPSTAYDWSVNASCPGSEPHTSYGGGAATGSFITTATTTVCNDIYEANNTSNQARTIPIGGTIYAGISSATDVDWFKVITPNNSNTNLLVSLNNLPADYDLYVYNKSLKLVSSSINSGNSNENVIYNSTARKATYYIKAVGKNGAYNTAQCYNLLVQVSSNARTATHASAPVSELTENTTKQFLYPNPASGFLYLDFNSRIEGSGNVEILNTTGQLIKQNAIKISKGYNHVRISINDIKEGMYLLRINNGELNMIRKFVIAR